MSRRSSTLLTVTAMAAAGCVGVVAGGDGGGEQPVGQAPGTGGTTSPGPGAGGAGGTAPAGGAGGIAMPMPPAACQSTHVPAGRPMLRRLTPDEYANTARDLLAAPTAKPQILASEGGVISGLEVEKLVGAAAALTALKAHHAPAFLPCNVSGAHNPACVDKFIDNFATAAFRRPLDPEEKVWLKGVYDRTRQLAGVSPPITFREAIDTLAQVILQSLQFIYIQESGVADPRLPAGIRRLSGHERASRLSYFMWNSMPDRALFDAAASGKLDSPAGVRAEAERLLASPRARQMVRRFASQWMELDGTVQHIALEEMEKSAKRFPFDNAELRKAMRTETEALYERVFFDKGGSFRTLMTTTEAYVNGPLATLYGVKGGPTTAGTYSWVQLDAAQRAGMFTRAAFLTLHATADMQAPIRRGVYVIRHGMCFDLPPPPPDADDALPVPVVGKSNRELTDAKTAGGLCAACHNLINPVGYAFDHYDAMGRFQTTETGIANGKTYSVPVNARATIPATDIAGTVNGGVELSERLASSAMARNCAVETWFERALARKPSDADRCLVEDIGRRFVEKDNLRDLVLDVISSDAALFVEVMQ